MTFDEWWDKHGELDSLHMSEYHVASEAWKAALDMKCLALRKAGDDLAALCADAAGHVILTGPDREKLKKALQKWGRTKKEA